MRTLDRRKVIAGIFVAVGIALLVVPIYYHYIGGSQTNQLMEDFTDTVEDEQDEEETGESEEQTAISEEDAAIFAEGDVIAILEIKVLGIRYPVVEGATSANLNVAIGHLTETAGIGQTGNCVLAGHNGSRYGEYFTHLNQISIGDTVTLIDKSGTVYTYEVQETSVIDPYDKSIKNQGEESELTLFTCSQGGSMRFAVRCILSE